MTAWYRAGTVEATNGQTTVTGTLTAWLANAKVGDLFAPDADGRGYEITAVTSNTEIEIFPAYAGSSGSGKEYGIARIAPNWNSVSELSVSLADILETQQSILSGEGVPNNSIGQDGDVYFRQDEAEYYRKSAGEWELVTSLTGPQGEQGIQGIQGPSGVDAGIRWAFDDSTTTNADPGSGDLRLNNASLASATEIAISYACGETGTPDVEDYVKSWDDSTTTGNRGTLIVKKASAPENYAIYSITSAITDGTTYGRFTISHLSSDGSFTAADVLSVQFLRSGDKGSDGAGVGDVTAASNFGADNVLIKSDGTSKGVQATGITVDSSNNVSGVNNVTGADTDFVTGTAGTNGNLVAWNGDGDAVDSGVATAAVLTSGDIGVSVQGYDADTLKGDVEDQGPLTGGASITPKDLGSGIGTITVDVADRPCQLIANDTGAFSLAVGTARLGSTTVIITNGASAGTITDSDFDATHGDPFTTTNGHIFRCTVEYWGAGMKWLFRERMS